MSRERVEQAVRDALRELGIELDATALMQLAASDGAMGTLLRVAYEALHGPYGYAQAFLEGRTFLVARDADRLVLGVQWGRASRPFPPSGWKIAPWSKELARNRRVVAAWAKTETENVVVAKIVRPPVRMDDRRAGGAALLAAVIADPADAAARLVYADWLLERGDPRGELIRLYQEGKHDEFLALRHKHAPVILAPYAEFDNGTVLRTGFVETLFAFAGKLAKHPEVFALEPFRAMYLDVKKAGELAALARRCADGLARITELALRGHQTRSHPRGVPIAPSAIAPALPRLAKLDLDYLDEPLPEWRAFLGALPVLTELRIAGLPVLRELFGDPAMLPNLRHLTIGPPRWDVRDETQALDLARLLAQRDLATVSIIGLRLGTAAMTELVETLLAVPRLEIRLPFPHADDATLAALGGHARVKITR